MRECSPALTAGSPLTCWYSHLAPLVRLRRAASRIRKSTEGTPQLPCCNTRHTARRRQRAPQAGCRPPQRAQRSLQQGQRAPARTGSRRPQDTPPPGTLPEVATTRRTLLWNPLPWRQGKAASQKKSAKRTTADLGQTVDIRVTLPVGRTPPRVPMQRETLHSVGTVYAPSLLLVQSEGTLPVAKGSALSRQQPLPAQRQPQFACWPKRSAAEVLCALTPRNMRVGAAPVEQSQRSNVVFECFQKSSSVWVGGNAVAFARSAVLKPTCGTDSGSHPTFGCSCEMRRVLESKVWFPHAKERTCSIF